MADSRKLGFGPIAAPAGAFSWYSPTTEFDWGPRRAAARVRRRSGGAGRQDRAVHGQERQRARHRGAGRAKATRLIVIGTGKADDRKPSDFVKLGGIVQGRVPSSATEVTVVLELGRRCREAGCRRRCRARRQHARLHVRPLQDQAQGRRRGPAQGAHDARRRRVAAARKAWVAKQAVADGVVLARDLVNEPPNVLYPVEFARRAAALRKLGVGVEVLDVKAMRKLGMGALLGVGQGSTQTAAS